VAYFYGVFLYVFVLLAFSGVGLAPLIGAGAIVVFLILTVTRQYRRFVKQTVGPEYRGVRRREWFWVLGIVFVTVVIPLCIRGYAFQVSSSRTYMPEQQKLLADYHMEHKRYPATSYDRFSYTYHLNDRTGVPALHKVWREGMCNESRWSDETR
jgi:hypothetical protein